MSQGDHSLAIGAVAALVWVGLGFFGFEAGGEGARRELATHLGKAQLARRKAIETAIADERLASAKLRARVAELEGQIAAADPKILQRLERDVTRRRKQTRPYDALVMDESLDITAIAQRIGREAVGEELAGATLEVIKGRRAFILQLGLPKEPFEPEALATLCSSLSELPERVHRSWIKHVGLTAPDQQPLYFEVGTLSPEAWRVLLETFRVPHHRVSGAGFRNSSLYRIAGISLSYELDVETTLELYGPQRVTKTLGPNRGSSFIRVKGGFYLLHAHAEGQVPFLAVMRLYDGHMSRPHLSTKQR